MKRIRRVLVAEDEAALRTLISHVLEGAGFTVDVAASGSEAIQKIRDARYDLVTLDLMMPEGDGWEVLEFLRSMTRTAPPVVLVSGTNQTLTRPHPLGETVVGVVYKPFNPRDLLTTCLTALSAREKKVPRVLEERRRAPRRNLIMDVRLASSVGSPLIVGKLHSLSTVGAQLRLPVALRSEQVVRVALRLPGRERTLFVDGRIHYCEPGIGDFVSGLGFQNMKPDVQRELEDALPVAVPLPRAAVVSRGRA